jgi:pterin-4a-carbinolamine dehydratase
MSIIQPPIPSLPEQSSEYPTPHITDEDLKTYVEPLYSLYWGIILPAKYNSGSSTVAQLGRVFKFNDFATAVDFIQDVAAIARSENHHPTLKVEGGRVSFATLTHYGRAPLTSAANLMGRNIVPSLTIRDIRLAILAETLFRDSYVANKRGKNPVGARAPKSQRPSSLEEIEALKQRFRNVKAASSTQSRPPKCPCCKGSHFLRSCPDRKSTKPRTNCRLCGQLHWIVDCPVLVPKHQ